MTDAVTGYEDSRVSTMRPPYTTKEVKLLGTRLTAKPGFGMYNWKAERQWAVVTEDADGKIVSRWTEWRDA